MEQTRKRSKKRDAILSCLCNTDTHPSAEWIYHQLKPQIPDLSLATVYRNLASIPMPTLFVPNAAAFWICQACICPRSWSRRPPGSLPGRCAAVCSVLRDCARPAPNLVSPIILRKNLQDSKNTF